MDGVRLREVWENTLVIDFEGRISGTNAAEVEKELFSFSDNNSHGQIIFDFEKLEYISSNGLRVLLRMARREKKRIQIKNISSEVYEVLEITGFVRLFDAYKKMKKYHLSELELIGMGVNGEVYRVDKENVVKVFQAASPLAEIDLERTLAQEALVAGIPTAISYSVIMADDRYGIVFELINAETLSHALVENPDRFDELTDKYITLYKQIHEIEADPDCFPSIKEIYYSAIEECASFYTEEESAKLRALVESIPERSTLIHGDYHPNNIMLQNDELILIDMGDVSYGHPIFDFLATASTQVNLVKLSPEYAAMHTKMPPELITKTWNRLIEKYFDGYDKTGRDKIEKQIVWFSRLKAALAPHYARGADPRIISASIEDAKANFIPGIEEMIGTLDW